MQRDTLPSARRTRGWLCLLALGALVLLAACGSSPSTGSAATPTAPATTPAGGTPTSNPTPTATAAPSGPSKTVTITTDSSGSFAFSPTTLTISVGTTVIWMNTTQAPHTVTSNDGKTFDTGTNNPVNPGVSFSFTFTKAGTFPYHCQFHPYMKATIIVT
jgi:plastocyanin